MDVSWICVEAMEKMAVGPPKSATQDQASNRLKRLLLKVMVVSVEEKLVKNQQVRFRKTSNPEPLLTRPDGVRRIGGVILNWAFLWNCGNQSS